MKTRAGQLNPWRRRRGSATEIFVIAGGLILLLVIASGLYTHGLNRVKTRQAIDLIATLDRAVRAYGDCTGTYPPGTRQDTLRRTLPALQALPESRAVLAGLPSALLHVVDGQPRCRDPWGQPLRCLTDHSQRADSRDRFQSNGGVPVFESSGPDRSFGDDTPSRQADNIRSDEPLDLPPPDPQRPTTAPAAESADTRTDKTLPANKQPGEDRSPGRD
jgi:hypothetical protein